VAARRLGDRQERTVELQPDRSERVEFVFE
jgi:hypothetical protein